MRIRISGPKAVWVVAMAAAAVVVTGSWWAALFVYLATFEFASTRKRNPIRDMKEWVDSFNDGGVDGKCKRCGSKMDFDHAGWLCPNGCPTHTW